MNKRMTMIMIFTIVVILVAFFSLNSTSSKIKNEDEIRKIVEDSNLDIVINLGEYSYENYNDSNLLDVAMQIAEKNNLFNEYNDENTYVQYADKDDVHLIIYELTGHIIEAPIEITDFYYLYDSENDYYYFRPSTPSYFKINQVNSIKKKGSNYLVNCLISKTIDTAIVESYEVEISLTYEEENNLVKYMVNQIRYVSNIVIN